MLTVPGLDLKNRLPVWLTVLVVSRDIGIVLTVAVWNLAVARRTFRPSMLGKITTAVYLMTCTMALYENYLGESSVIVPILIYTSLGLTVASAAHYAWRMMKAT
jgi:cardiolipin synthase